MSKGFRYEVPLCQEDLIFYSKKHKTKLIGKCNKPSVASWIWKDCDGEAFFVCQFHDKAIQMEETGEIKPLPKQELKKYSEKQNEVVA